MSQTAILIEHIPLVRRVLATSSDGIVRDMGTHGEFLYLVEYEVAQEDLDVQDQLIAIMSSKGYAQAAVQAWRRHCDALQPYLGRKLLKAAIQFAARRHEIFIEPDSGTIVDLIRGEVPPNQAANFDPSDRSTWLNMHLEWFKTIEEDPAYREWLESTLFPPPTEFFDAEVFEASRMLYDVRLQDSLLEDAVYRGIPSAGFQKAELNTAVRDAASELFSHCEAKWFHVNVHDNVARFVEKFGHYSFDYPLVPIYILLIYHQAEEGGTTYAGVASATREWVLLFEDGLHISVHGPKAFVDRVVESLGLEEDP